MAQPLRTHNDVDSRRFMELSSIINSSAMLVPDKASSLTKLCDVCEQFRGGGMVDFAAHVWTWEEVEGFEADVRWWQGTRGQYFTSTKRKDEEDNGKKEEMVIKRERQRCNGHCESIIRDMGGRAGADEK